MILPTAHPSMGKFGTNIIPFLLYFLFLKGNEVLVILLPISQLSICYVVINGGFIITDCGDSGDAGGGKGVRNSKGIWRSSTLKRNNKCRCPTESWKRWSELEKLVGSQQHRTDRFEQQIMKVKQSIRTPL